MLIFNFKSLYDSQFRGVVRINYWKYKYLMENVKKIIIQSRDRATDFPRLRNRGRNNGIRHLKRNPYCVKITVT